MSRQIDELKQAIQRADPDFVREVDVYFVDPANDADCHFCRDQGLPHMLCPYCGKWDHRSPVDVEDDLLAEFG